MDHLQGDFFETRVHMLEPSTLNIVAMSVREGTTPLVHELGGHHIANSHGIVQENDTTTALAVIFGIFRNLL